MTPDMIDAMIAAGLTREQMAALIKHELAKAEEKKAAKRAGNAERQRRFKAKNNAGNALSAFSSVTDVTADAVPPIKETSPRPPKENYPLSSEPSVPRCENARRHVWPEDFAKQVWDLFPRKTEKQAGMMALADLHRRDRLPWSELIDGIRSLTDAVEDPKFAPALHRWLKRERWQDQHPAARPPPMATRNNRSLIDGLDEIERRFSDVPPSYPRLAG